jgi:hypothetical protein
VRSSWIFVWAPCLALTLTAPGRPAHAGEQILVSLDYDADRGASCPTAGEFQKAIRGYLRWDPFRQPAQRRIVIRIHASAGRLEGQVQWRDAKDQWEGERTFSSASETCAKMSRAMALATAIQIELLASIAEGDEPAPEQPAEVLDEPAATYRLVAAEPPPPPSPPSEPRVAVSASLGVIKDVGDGPLFAVPRLAVTLGRPSSLGVRITASGFGPNAEVRRTDGAAEIGRLLATVEVTRLFRAQHRLQPLLALGAGLQDLHVHGISAMPALAAAHDARVFSGVLVAGGGVAIMLGARIFFVVEADVMLFRPSMKVSIGSSLEAAHLDSVALFANGGVLARF